MTSLLDRMMGWVVNLRVSTRLVEEYPMGHSCVYSDEQIMSRDLFPESHGTGDLLNLNELFDMHGNRCPDCEGNDSLLRGHVTRRTRNFACMNCGAEFQDRGPLFVTRVSIRGKPDTERMERVYHVRGPFQRG